MIVIFQEPGIAVLEYVPTLHGGILLLSAHES